jgi:hypothetical protein
VGGFLATPAQGLAEALPRVPAFDSFHSIPCGFIPRRIAAAARGGAPRRTSPQVAPADLAAPPRRRTVGSDRRTRRPAEPRRHRKHVLARARRRGRARLSSVGRRFFGLDVKPPLRVDPSPTDLPVTQRAPFLADHRFCRGLVHEFVHVNLLSSRDRQDWTSCRAHSTSHAYAKPQG